MGGDGVAPCLVNQSQDLGVAFDSMLVVFK
jgi:hypothetical protein